MAFSIGINELKDVSTLLADRTGYPFSDMPLSFLKRRMNIFFERNRIRNVEHFTEQLDNNMFVETFLYSISADCTEMFRDPGFWRSLNHKVLPKINHSTLPVWFPDAVSGHELYSFLIIDRINNPESPKAVMFTHPSAQRISEISEGKLFDRNDELTDSNFKRLEIEVLLTDYISSDNNTNYLSSNLLKNAKGEKGWYLSTPSFGNQFSLIVFRNVMLYTNRALQEKIGNHLYQLLSPGGFLAIGIKESLPENLADKMEMVDEQERIFKKPGILNNNGI
ncbi:MAG: CheR family methyltransferase [Breznakibacter sp.]